MKDLSAQSNEDQSIMNQLFSEVEKGLEVQRHLLDDLQHKIANFLTPPRPVPEKEPRPQRPSEFSERLENLSVQIEERNDHLSEIIERIIN